MGKPKDLFNPLFKNGPVETVEPSRGGKKARKEDHPRREKIRPEAAQDNFLEAMSGVKPLPEEPRSRVRPQETRREPLNPAPDKRREVMGHLFDLVKGPVEIAEPSRGEKKARKEDHPDKEKVDPEAAQDTFLEAMSGVEPLPDEPRSRIKPQGTRREPLNPAPDERREVMGHLLDLVKGSVEMDITFSDEYIEGSVRGLSRELMKRLKRGEFPTQDHIDLHGLTREEAQAAVKEFLLTSFKLGLRCVLIIHGRGLNSPESFPVLKEGLPIWLGRGAVRRIVLAFATARPYDGGTGAVYVLLRKTAGKARELVS